MTEDKILDTGSAKRSRSCAMQPNAVSTPVLRKSDNKCRYITERKFATVFLHIYPEVLSK